MSYNLLLIHEVTIVNPTLPGGVDRYGDPVEGASAPVTEDARVEPTRSDETIVGRDTRVSRFLVFLREGSVITALSKVTYNGDEYRVVGDPSIVDDRTGPHHVEATLERIAG